MMALSEIIRAGMDNPDCSFFLGAFMGQIMVIRWVLAIYFIHIVWKIVDRLALDPFLDWVKKKWRDHRENREV
jgi:hypothetical protein